MENKKLTKGDVSVIQLAEDDEADDSKPLPPAKKTEKAIGIQHHMIYYLTFLYSCINFSSTNSYS